VIEIADVFRRFADDYLTAHEASMLPSHQLLGVNERCSVKCLLLGHL
jgi:hypothetical protein